MASMAISLKIRDYSVWRPVFDAENGNRIKAGVTNGRVYRRVEDSNDLIILFDVADIAKARGWFSSAELKSAMAKAGVIGTPAVHIIG